MKAIICVLVTSFSVFYSVSAMADDISEDISVVAGNEFFIDEIAYSDLKRLFLGRASEINDNVVTVFDLPSGNQNREKFYTQVLRRTPEQMKRYWARAIFTGTAMPPKVIEDEEEMKAAVNEEDAIGYISPNDIDDSVKELDILKGE